MVGSGRSELVVLREVFDSCCRDSELADRSCLAQSLLACSASAALFGLPGRLCQEDGSKAVWERVYHTVISGDVGSSIGWREFVEGVLPAALMASVSARAAFAARVALALGQAAPCQEHNWLTTDQKRSRYDASPSSSSSSSLPGTGTSPKDRRLQKVEGHLHARCNEDLQGVSEALTRLSAALEQNRLEQATWAAHVDHTVQSALGKHLHTGAPGYNSSEFPTSSIPSPARSRGSLPVPSVRAVGAAQEHAAQPKIAFEVLSLQRDLAFLLTSLREAARHGSPSPEREQYDRWIVDTQEQLASLERALAAESQRSWLQKRQVSPTVEVQVQTTLRRLQLQVRAVTTAVLG